MEFEVPREGVVLTPEIPLSELQKYVGRYGDAAGATEFTILIQNQRLAVRLPNNTSFDLLPPDATGRRATRANVGLAVTFEESPTGAVSAMNFQRPGALPVMRLTPVASTLPTVDRDHDVAPHPGGVRQRHHAHDRQRSLPSVRRGGTVFIIHPPETTDCERTLISTGRCRFGLC